MPQPRNTTDSLLQKLDELLDGETRLSQAIPPCLSMATAESLRNKLSAYSSSCEEQKEKIRAVLVNLSYVPGQLKNRVIDKLVSNTKEMLSTLESDPMRNVLMASCIQTINDHKVTAYKEVVDLANQVHNEKLVALFQNILNDELATSVELKKIAAQVAR